MQSKAKMFVLFDCSPIARQCDGILAIASQSQDMHGDD